MADSDNSGCLPVIAVIVFFMILDGVKTKPLELKTHTVYCVLLDDKWSQGNATVRTENYRVSFENQFVVSDTMGAWLLKPCTIFNEKNWSCGDGSNKLRMSDGLQQPYCFGGTSCTLGITQWEYFRAKIGINGAVDYCRAWDAGLREALKQSLN